jgi:LacI family transcriptional regulator, galactose operon repressor
MRGSAPVLYSRLLLKTFSSRVARSTIRDVARIARVSVSTVSRVLNDHPYVTDETRRRVAEAMDELHYRPDVAARSMRTGATRAIGFVVADFSNPLFSAIAMGADSVLHPLGYSLVLANSVRDPEREAEVIAALRDRRVDGLLLSLADERTEGLRERLSAFRSVVLLDRDVPGLDCDRVLTDHAAGIRAALDHLLALGHRRVAMIAGIEAQRGIRERLGAFREGMGDLYDEQLLRTVDPLRASGHEAARELLELRDRPTALIAAHNQLFAGILSAVRELALRVPDDLSLVCCEDDDLTRLNVPPIDVVSRDMAALGEAAAGLLLARLKGNGPPREVTLPAHYEIRSSTAAPHGTGVPIPDLVTGAER